MYHTTSPFAEDLLSTVTPALEDGAMVTLEQALAVVKKQWTCEQLIGLLSEKSSEVRKIAALALGFVGDKKAIHPLAVALHDQDTVVNKVAEHALWCIWFRSGKCESVCLVRCGSADLQRDNYAAAIEKFNRAITLDPTFAEAYNQRAIAFYLDERYAESIGDCKQALKLIPQHFGAMAGMGHCHAHLKQYAEARRCYRLALAIDPCLEGVAASLQQVEALLQGTPPTVC